MSVAFRRESDEEHLEPKFERPIPPGRNLVTRRGLALIEAEIVRLEAELGKTEGEEARSPLARDLRYWCARHATAELAPPPAAGEIGIGSRVTIRQNGATRTVTVTGSDEAEPAAGRIGFLSPLAQALIGGEVGEEVEFAGKPLTILSIEEADDGEG